MNFFKKLSLALSIVLLLPTMSLAETFDDVSSANSNYVAIEYLVSIGTLEGYDDGSFQPSKTINRAELMKVLVAGQGIDPSEDDYQNCFPDVEEDWYAKYVCYAAEQEWVAGYPDGSFQPAQTVNKVEAVKMLVNALNLDEQMPETVEEDLFEDTDSSQWYAPYISVAKSLNLLEETSGDFEPTGEMDRGGVAENIFRTLVVQDLDVEAYSESSQEEFLESHDLMSLIDEVDAVESYVVDRVVDGDTLVLDNGEYVRLLGVDAPEDNECFEQDSTDYLIDLTEGKTVTLEMDPLNDDRDTYDRLLRYVFVDGVNVNLQMVEDGYAQYYDTYSLSLDSDFQAAEDAAEADVLPIWEACFVVASESNVYISYVYYDGEVYQVESDEYVELTNDGNASINLEDYYINGSKGGEKYTFGDVELGAGESIKIYTDMGEYSFENDNAIWSNSGETVYLYDGEDQLVDSYSY